MSNRKIPQEAIDALPKGMTILGWGGEFERPPSDFFLGAMLNLNDKGVHWLSETLWKGTDVSNLYAAPTDSEIVKLNAVKGKLPFIAAWEDLQSPIFTKDGYVWADWKDLSIKDGDPTFNQSFSALPEDSAERKKFPVYGGVVAYFPHALAAVSHMSWEGNNKHHPGKPLHWDQGKSTDERDCIMRHMIDATVAEQQGDFELSKKEWTAVAWRALGNLERILTDKCQYIRHD